MASLLPFGNNQNGRIMKKSQKDEIVLETFKKGTKALKKAQKIAEFNRDVEALVVISERWLTFMQLAESLDKPRQQMVGFTTLQEMDED